MALVLGYLGIVVLGLVICLGFALIHHRRQNKDAVVTSWPIIGMLPGFLRNVLRLHDFVTEILEKSGGTFQFKGPWFCADHLNFIITSDPLNVHHVLNKNFGNYPKGPEFREVFEPLGDGILNVDSDLWRLQRKMFHLWDKRQRKFEVAARTIQRKVVGGLIPFLEHASETRTQVNLQEAFRRTIVFDNAIHLIFGLDPASHAFKFSIAEYHEVFEVIQGTVFRRYVLPKCVWKLQKWLQIGAERKLSKAVEIFDEFIYHCLSLKREKLSRDSGLSENEQEENNLDIMTMYLKEKENPYSDKFLKDVALSFVAAGRDTLNAGLSWFFWLIATHPSVESKILTEMKENLPEKDDKYGFYGVEDLNKLVYLQAVLFETFRLYPSVPFDHKTTSEADTLPSGHHLSQKTRVLISFYSMGRMEEIWSKDCLEFKPERWIDSKKGGLLHMPSHKYASFSTGPRTCLGKDIVFIQMKTVAIAILKCYCLQVVEGHHPVSPTLTISLHMKHGLQVRVSKRCV